MASLEWYYAKGNQQHGPVSASDLKQFADRGELEPEDLVWCEKLEDWTPARKVGGLFEEEPPAPPPRPVKAPPRPPLHGGSPPAFERSEAAFARSRQRSGRHLFDRVIEFARGQFTTQFADVTTTIFTLAGHYGLYAAMALLLLFSLFLSVETKQVNMALLGMAGLVMLVVLQYAARCFSEALDRLNRSTPARMQSTAFLNCFALLHVFGGLVALLALTVLAVQTGRLSLVLPAIAVFILFQYVAVLALNPGTLSITIGADVTAGEEAIGVLSFLVKLWLRLVPVAFGVGVVWGTLNLSYACYLVVFPPVEPEKLIGTVGALLMAAFGDSPISDEAMKMLPAQDSAIGASTILMGSAALPIVTYVLFLVYYLLIDVFRAVLSLPGKLDKMIDDR